MSEFLKQLEINARHVDVNISGFTQEFLNRMSSEQLDEFFVKVVSQRPDLTPLHFGLLLYSSARYALAKNAEPNEIERLTYWPEAFDVLAEKQAGVDVMAGLINGYVNITNPQRYGAISMAARLVCGDDNLTYIDIGSGYYPHGLGKYSSETMPVALDPETRILQEIIHSDGIPFGNFNALDPQEPNPVWAAACVWEPIAKLPSTIDRFSKELLETNSRIIHHKASVCDPDFVAPSQFEVVSMANVRYQMTPEGRLEADKNLLKLLKIGGICIEADYLPGGSKRQPFTYAITVKQRINGGFNEPRVVLLTDSADCSQVKMA